MLLAFLVVPVTTSAYDGFGRIDRNNLDDEIVDQFPLPILFGVDLSTVVPDFGDPRDGGERSHEGQDIRAPKGTPIVSPTEAIVIKTGDGVYSGKYVYTANPGGETFRYMHLDTIASDLDSGDLLDVGDFIGTVGDTGNAPEGVYHLHLEILNEDNDPTDPFERFDPAGFTLKEKMSFLRDIFSGMKQDEEYAEFLVETFNSDFMTAYQKGYSMPNVIDEVLEDAGASTQSQQLQRFTELIAALPMALQMELRSGDQGPAVQLLQLYLIYTGNGPARDKLRAAGPTGYFGLVTTAALAEFQKDKLIIDNKGVYDAQTRTGMMKYQYPNLNFN